MTAANPQPQPFTYADIGKLKWLDCCMRVRMADQILRSTTARHVHACKNCKRDIDLHLMEGHLVSAHSPIAFSFSLDFQ